MEKRSALYLLLLLFLIVRLPASSQTVREVPEIEPLALTPQQLYSLSSLPPLTVPDRYLGADAPMLPWWIDNSTQPYFRPITSQTGFECGQSAGIAFTFTYEIDRLRSVPADNITTQYPTHFTWDFLNNGDNYTGSSCFDSWEILRTCGTMNVADYGGDLGTGGYLRWISGYDKYYNGMSNRINYMRSIRVDSPEGLKTLKYWLSDHLEGSSVGGLAILYGKYFGPTVVLPAGTPEAGKYVETSWGPSPTHTFTVCGYNDSIRFDYNGDGRYTNNIDINGDGVVDMHDWEIGGLKLSSGFAGTNWGNGGFCYTMYKCLADAIEYGGIWNHSVYVISTKDTCVPKLTAKVVLKHTSRNKLKLTMGVSTDLSATTPAYLLDLPIFRYQGGDHFMQGGDTEDDKTIEFGLDLTPLINHVNNDQPAKFFLQVQENDSAGSATGEIISYSLIDYTTGSPLITQCPETNVDITNNALTTLSITAPVSLPRPVITTDSLPPAELNQLYNYQLNASGATPPYLWEAILNYPETTSSIPYPAISGQKLTLTDNNTGYSIVTLPFDFSFYNRSVNKLYIYSDGYILFDDQPFNWPYLIDKILLLKYSLVIAPFMCDLDLYSNQSDGIWYEPGKDSVTIWWKTSIFNMPDSTDLNFAVKLFKDGRMEFYYGDMVYPASTIWTGGISCGDNKNYQFSLLNNSPAIPANTLDQLQACGFPEGMKITENGNFTGIPQIPCHERMIKFLVTDNNNISSEKSLKFSAGGLQVNYTVNNGSDSIIKYGDTVTMSLVINNTGNQTVHNANLLLRTTDPFITITDSIQSAGDIPSGQSVTINNAFTFHESIMVPDGHSFPVFIKVNSSEQNFQKTFELVAFAPRITFQEIILPDSNNGMLDPGETTDMQVIFKNIGRVKVLNASVSIITGDSLLIINTGDAILGDMKPDSVKPAIFNITSAANAPSEHIYRMNSRYTGNNGYLALDSNYLLSGAIVEDFETGYFFKYDWYLGGHGLFGCDATESYEGNYAARSGWIYDNMETSLNLNVNVLENGKISFYKKVSCEHDPTGSCNYDYFAFYIDSREIARWDGSIDWTLESYDVTRGYHTFQWIYYKDATISWGSDCAWLDFITFPPFKDALPELSIRPSSFERSLKIGEKKDDTLYVANSGFGILGYTANVVGFSSGNSPVNVDPWLTLTKSNGFIFGRRFDTVFLHFNASGLAVKNYMCNISLHDSYNDSLLIPVLMHVLDSANSQVHDNGMKLKISSYPNPFYLITRLEYNLQKPDRVNAGVYEINGRKVRNLLLENQTAGSHQMMWDGCDDKGTPLEAGVYYCRIMTSDCSGTIKLIRLR